VLHSCRG